MAEKLVPNYIFESSWEVCNKVGGIYTVLSTRAKTLQERFKDHLIFIGPDCWKEDECPYFTEDKKLFKDWKKQLPEDLSLKIGRWNIPGNPIAILVDFSTFYKDKDKIYTEIWENFGVDSLHAYGDYDEASMFSYAAARVVESFYHYYIKENQKVIYQGNEWMTCMGLLYLRLHLPQIATIFTTHATSIGRSIAGNNKPLYQYLEAYNSNQMADELNMQSKHSIERQTAHNVDCFTTVSDITALECKELLDRDVDVVLPNGFEDDFVPKGSSFTSKRKKARETLLRVANALTGKNFSNDALLVSTSGRYEFRNKGIDVFVEAINKLRFDSNLKKEVIAFIEVPAWVHSARKDLAERLIFGNDLCVYPSYYEPWGYTPLEAVAFKVPCITTNLAGFGLWVEGLKGFKNDIISGVKVINRTDYNYWDVAEEIKNTIIKYSTLNDEDIKKARNNAYKISKKALWNKFIAYYDIAYDKALRKAAERN